jgi:hypothetical protein
MFLSPVKIELKRSQRSILTSISSSAVIISKHSLPLLPPSPSHPPSPSRHPSPSHHPSPSSPPSSSPPSTPPPTVKCQKKQLSDRAIEPEDPTLVCPCFSNETSMTVGYTVVYAGR